MKSRQSRYGRKMRGGTLIGIALGIVVGVLISFGVVWYLNKTPLPFVEKVTKPETASKPGTPVALPGKPGDKPIDKGERKFEFYDILEGKKPASPTGTATPSSSPGSPTPPANPAVQVTPAQPAADNSAAAGTLYLQAGAFQKPADAEGLKAKLAMLGFEAQVLPVEVPNKGTMHRVRVGPYPSADQMNRARDQLSQHGIPAAVVRVKE